MITAAFAAAVVLNGAGGPTAAALSVSPSHVALEAGGSAPVHLRTSVGARLLVHASVAGLALDSRGRPQVVGKRDAAAWLTVSPRTIAVGKAGATVTVGSRRPGRVRPGDHTAIVLLTATAPSRKGVAVAMRVGLVVTLRVQGHRIRRLVVTAVRAESRRPSARPVIRVLLANRGDVIESIGGARLQITLRRHGRVVARLRGGRRWLLPRTSTVVRFRCGSDVHGDVVARVLVAVPGGGTASSTFHLRL